MDSLLLTQGALGALSLVLSGFLVVNLVAAMLAGQVREIGVMKTLGASPWQIGGMYLALAGVLGALACLVAVPLAAVLGRAYARLSAEALNFELDERGIPLWVIAVQLASGALLPLVAAAIPVVRGCRLPVAAALRDHGIDPASAGGAGSRALARASGALSRPLLLSLRNAFRRRQRMALTVVTLALGGAVFLATLSLRASIRGTFDHVYGTLMRFDGSVRLAEPQTPAELEAVVGAVPGVERAEAWGAARAVMRDADGLLGNPLVISFVPPETAMLALPMDSGRWLRPGDGRTLVVSRGARERQPELVSGNEVTLVIGGRETRWRIVGEAASGPGAAIYAPREALAALGRAGEADLVVFTAAAGGPPDGGAAVVRRVRAELEASGLAVASAQVLAANRRVVEDNLIMVVGFLMVMAQLAIVVGALGLASTMSLAVLERTRELGVMRALGASHATLHAIVQAEGLVVALLAWAVAVPLSVPMSVVLAQRFGRAFLPVAARYVPEVSGVFWWLLVSVGASVVACAWPAWRATRVPTAQALAYE